IDCAAAADSWRASVGCLEPRGVEGDAIAAPASLLASEPDSQRRLLVRHVEVPARVPQAASQSRARTRRHDRAALTNAVQHRDNRDHRDFRSQENSIPEIAIAEIMIS